MKRLALLILCIFLVSCRANEDYSLNGKRLYVTLENGSVTGELFICDEYVEFIPDLPAGVLIRVDETGGSITYSDITFDGVADMTYVGTIYDAIKVGSAEPVFKDKRLSELNCNEVKISVHKELPK